MLDNQTLSILQYNVEKSRAKVMIPLFESEGIQLYDVMAIQDPWQNPFQNTTNTKLNQTLNTHCMDSAKTRVYFLVNKRIATASYMITYYSESFVSLSLRLPNERTIDIHNLHNPGK